LVVVGVAGRELMEKLMGEMVRDSELMGELWESELVGEFKLEQRRQWQASYTGIFDGTAIPSPAQFAP